MMFAAAVGHRSGRATPSLRGAPQRQSMEIVRRETIYRNRNAVQTNPATSQPSPALLETCTGEGQRREQPADYRQGVSRRDREPDQPNRAKCESLG
jgi:hypothetical protein